MTEPSSKSRVAQRVAGLAIEIAAHQTRSRQEPDRAARKAALEDAIKVLDAFSRCFGRPSRALRPILRNEVLPLLGSVLSPSGIERLAGSVAWGVDDRAIEAVNGRRGRGQVTAFDALTAVTRQQVAAEIGPDLVARLCDALREPLERALRLEKADRGGRPQNLYRNYAVQELAGAWEADQGRPAPGGKSGPFFDCCHAALEELQLETDGLAECIQRTTKRLRRATAVRRQNPA